MNLRAKLLLQTAAIFLLLAGLLAGLQTSFLDSLLFEQTEERMTRVIKAAWQQLEERRHLHEATVGLLSDSPQIRELDRLSPEQRAEVLQARRERWDMDFLALVSLDGTVLARAGTLERGERLELPGLPPKPGAEVDGYAAMSRQQLAREGRAPPGGGAAGSVVVFAASRVAQSGGGAAMLVGGQLLDGDARLVEQIESTLFPDRTYQGRKVGSAAIFLGDRPVATTVEGPDGSALAAQPAPPEVVDEVLGRGKPWSGRLEVAGSGYLARFEPIRDPRDRVVGMLYVGALEKVYVDTERRVLLQGVAMVVLAMALAFLLIELAASRIGRQIHDLRLASGRIARGEEGVRAPVRGGDEMGRLAEEFNHMAAELEADRARIVEQKQALEAANRNYLEMLGFVSHELRGGLGTASFNLELVREGSYGGLTREQREGLELVRGSLHHLHEVIGNFLQLSRIERGELRPKKAAVALERDVVGPVLAEHAAQLREKGMKVETELPAQLAVLGDNGLLRVVFENLVSNAGKYGRTGGRIVVGARREGARVELWIWNEGAGVAPERAANLFQRFQRYDVDAEGGRRGSGLGLFIARQIVRQHGSELAVESQPGEWVRFAFQLEAAVGDAQASG